ncbi:MAG: DUF2892 domain-containing protein [Gammaproteobacteria bacterium]|jgi:hypothetical protein
MTDEQKKPFRIIVNMGWLDRIFRMIVGTALLVVPMIVLGMHSIRLDEGGSVSAWWYVAMFVSLYPFWTSTIGWDPVYRLVNVRTCGDSERNPCGTFPYEVDAAIGDRPIPDSEIEHSLTAAHHAGKDRKGGPGYDRV